MESLLVSACLLGLCCRYDGGGKPLPELARLKERYHLIPICPEIMGGLPTPRPPAEKVGQRVINRDELDVTAFFEKGAEEALKLARLFQCRRALLKERSPSCGMGLIYDGSFSGELIPGDGVCAALLKAHGIEVAGESQVEARLLSENGKSEDQQEE